MQKEGNIKLGGINNGLPTEYMEFVVTKANKGDSENFIPYPNLEPSSSLKVTLGGTLSDCFETGEMCFIKIEGISYYVKGYRGNAIAAPMDPNWEDPTDDLPFINLGDLGKFMGKYKMISQALLKVRVEGVDSSNVFYWKTKSAHSIKDTLYTLHLVSKMNLEPAFLACVPFNLSVFTRYRKDKEITYGRLDLPSAEDYLVGKERDESGLSSFISSMNLANLTIREILMKEAISYEDALDYFNVKELKIELDETDDNEIISIPEIQVTNELNDGLYKKLIEQVGGRIPDKILESACMNFGDKAFDIIEEEKFDIQRVIKRISEG